MIGKVWYRWVPTRDIIGKLYIIFHFDMSILILFENIHINGVDVCIYIILYCAYVKYDRFLW